MNIAIDIRALMNKQRTGVGEYTFELLNSLFNKADSNQYFLFYNSWEDVKENIPRWEKDNVHYVFTRWPNKLLNLFLYFGFVKLDKLITQKAKLKKQKIDWFFAPNISFISLSHETKLILTVHDLSFELFPECFKWKQRVWHKILRPKKMCQRADIIFTPSKNTKQDIVREWMIESEKVKVTYLGLCSHIVENEKINTEQIRKKYNLPDKYILYLGTIEPRKNILAIIRAYQKSSILNSGFMLIVAGASGWKNNKIFKAIESTAGVKYIGYVEDEDKKEIYKGSSLFVYPSLYEGFGLPVLEALACGVPVITSNRSSLSEIFGKYVVLVNPNNTEEAAQAILETLNNNIKSAKIDLNKFDWHKLAEKFNKILTNYGS